MSEELEKKAYGRLANFTVISDSSASDDVYGFLVQGLEAGTVEADSFFNFHKQAAIQMRT